MHITNREGTRPLSSPHGEVVYELMGAAAGGSVKHSLAEIHIPPGAASRPHYHPEAEESYYILSGTATVIVDKQEAQLQPGDGIAILANQVHQIANRGEEDLVFIAVCVPAWTPNNSIYVD